jgi:ATP-dependent Clp protease ATP-binding subunit ClpC
VDLEVDKVQKRLSEHQLSLRLTQEARQYLAEKGYEPNLGARPLRRVIQMEVEDALSEGVLADRFHAGDMVLVSLEGGELVFDREGVDESLPVAEMGNGKVPPRLETVLS